jgi:hypothetical protein
MPAKKTVLPDAERRKRIRETAREIGTDNSPEAFDRAFKRVVTPKEDRGASKTETPQSSRDQG